MIREEEKGDTLVFVAAAFADGSEKVLGDLLEKIPGLSITPSGGIRYEGVHIVRFSRLKGRQFIVGIRMSL